MLVVTTEDERVNTPWTDKCEAALGDLSVDKWPVASGAPAAQSRCWKASTVYSSLRTISLALDEEVHRKPEV